MRRPPQLLLSVVVSVLAAGSAEAHGGAFRGPGDSVVSGGPPPAAPGPSGGAPVGPNPLTQPPTSTNVPSGVASTAGMSNAEPDPSIWQLWWGYNNAAYLDVKGAVHSSDLTAGSAAFFLGRQPRGGASDRMIPSREVIEKRVVPALLRVLATERDADMVTGALVALAKIGEVPGSLTSTSDHISAFLSDGNQEIAETAAISLGILADSGSVDALGALLFDLPAGRELVEKKEVPWRTRAFAAFGLGLIGNQTDQELLREGIVNTLMDALGSGGVVELATPDIAVACVSAIGLIPLSTEVETPGVGASGRMRQIAWLLEFQKDPELPFTVRAHVPTAISRLMIGAPDSWGLQRMVGDVWIESLALGTQAHRSVQQSSVLALGRIGRPGTEPIDEAIRAVLLRASKTSPNFEVKTFSLIALAQIGSRAGARQAEQAVAREIREHLIRRLEGGATVEHAWAALALGVLGRSDAAGAATVEAKTDELLITALAAARSPHEIGATAVACGMRRQEAANEALLEKLAQVRDDEARGYVTLALGMTGAVDALEPIQTVVRDSKYRPELLRQAAISLGLLGDKDLVPELVDMLERASSLSAQASIAFGLGSIGDARSIEPLIEMLQNPRMTPRARAFAAVALGIVADKEPLPWNAKLSLGVNYRANTTTLTDGRGAGILEIL